MAFGILKLFVQLGQESYLSELYFWCIVCLCMCVSGCF